MKGNQMNRKREPRYHASTEWKLLCFAAAYCLASSLILYWLGREGNFLQDPGFKFLEYMWFFAIAGLLWQPISDHDMCGFRYSVSKEGITMYARRNVWQLRWQDVTQWKMLGIDRYVNANDKATAVWLLFASEYITPYEINGLSKFTMFKDNPTTALVLKHKGSIALFQCGLKQWSRIREFFPEEIRKEFDETYGEISPYMNRRDRRMNR